MYEAPHDIRRRETIPATLASRRLKPAQRAPSQAFSIARREGPWRDALLRRMLAVGDFAAALLAAVSLAFLGPADVDEALWAAVATPIVVLVAKLLGLYDRDQRSLRHLTVDELPVIFMWALASTATVAVLLAATPAGWPAGAAVLQMGIIAATAAVVLRIAVRAAWRRVTPPEAAILIGSGGSALAVRRKLELFPDIHVTVSAQREKLTVDDLREPALELADADRIVVAAPPADEALIAELIAFCRRYRVKLTVVPSLRKFFGTGVELRHVADLPVLEFNTWDVSRSTQLLKRSIDIVVSVAALLILSPLFVIVAVLVLVHSGRPIVFTQVRAGQNGSPFTMLKFRTMVAGAEDMLEDLLPLASLSEPVFKLRRDPRVTWVGRLLRRTSLDELPQLVNVLRGDMSLVGPRPEQLDLVHRYSADHLFRLAVKPGLTGPMQVYGRGELTFEERLAVEREYVENLSVARDLHILALTVASLLHGRGAY